MTPSLLIHFGLGSNWIPPEIAWSNSIKYQSTCVEMCTVRAESIHIPMLRVRLSDSARSRWASTFHLSICSLAKLRIYDYQWLHLISTENPATNPNHQFDQVAKCHVCSCFFHSLLSTFCVLTRSSPNPPRPHDVWPPPWAEPPRSADAAAPEKKQWLRLSGLKNNRNWQLV